MENRLALASRLQGYIEQLFPNWTHRRYRHRWERRWLNPEFSPFWKTDQPQEELVDAIESGWFPKNQRVIDLGCGNGEVSRWLAGQGFAVLGLDYSATADLIATRKITGLRRPTSEEEQRGCSRIFQRQQRVCRYWLRWER